MRKVKGKKWLKYTIIIAVILAVIAGIITFFITRRKKAEVSVYSVSEIGSGNYWENSSESSGMIKEDKMQAVYLSSTQTVEKVVVKEGQKVKEGDVLLRYSTTLSNLELERKDIDIKKMELEITRAQKELEQIKTYQPGVPTYGSLPVEEEKQPVTLTNPQAPNLSAPVPTVIPENETSPAPLTGEGTLEKPYLFIWSIGKEYEKEFIQKLIARAGSDKTEVIAVFMIRENSSLTGNLISTSKMKFTKKGEDYTFSILDTTSGNENDPLYPNKQEPVELEQPEPEIPEVGPIYTAIEIQKMTIDKEKEISEMLLNIKIARSEYKKLQEEAKNTVVYSKINGVVKTVLSVDDATKESKPIVVVSSGGGYYVEGRIGELDLNDIKIGQKVNVQAFESGTSTEGTIDKISSYPYSDSWYNGIGNSNVSYYPYTVRISEDANLKSGEYARLSLVAEEEKTNSFYMMSAFILSENGKYYAYIAGEGDKLEKRELNIGKNMHGMLEVRGGMTMDDRIAFPYGKNIKEGTSVVDGSIEDLYNGM